MGVSWQQKCEYGDAQTVPQIPCAIIPETWPAGYAIRATKLFKSLTVIRTILAKDAPAVGQVCLDAVEVIDRFIEMATTSRQKALAYSDELKAKVMLAIGEVRTAEESRMFEGAALADLAKTVIPCREGSTHLGGRLASGKAGKDGAKSDGAKGMWD